MRWRRRERYGYTAGNRDWALLGEGYLTRAAKLAESEELELLDARRGRVHEGHRALLEGRQRSAMSRSGCATRSAVSKKCRSESRQLSVSHA